MNQSLNDLGGIIASPGITLAKLMEKKVWVLSFILILVATFVFTFVTYPINKVEQAKLIRNSEIADRLPEEQLANLDKFTPVQRVTSSFFQMVFIALALVIGAFFVYLFFKVANATGTYGHFFCGVVNASIIDVGLGGLLKSLLVLQKKSIFVSTSLTLLTPGSDFRSLGFQILSQFDFFSLWFLAALALGIAGFEKMPVKKSIFVTVLYFLFKSTVIVAISYFSMRLIKM